MPVTYINSAAAIKAFVGERGGTVCTSSNAAPTLQWAFARGEKILFLPDQHLGRNTAYKMGIPLDEMVVWDPNEIFGGLDVEQVTRARMILWKGHCSVHTRFSVPQIRNIRKQHPNVRVIVPHLGGGFGGKCEFHYEAQVAALARAARRPVRLVFSRREEFVAPDHRREGQVLELETGVRNDGSTVSRRATASYAVGT